MAKDFMDQPPYDAVRLEAERLARAKAFAKIVRNLARFNMRTDDLGPTDTWVYRGAHYDLPDGRGVDVARQGYFRKPEYSASVVLLSDPWVEHMGVDGLRRRVRKTREINYSVASDIQMPRDNENENDDEPLDYVPPELERALKRFQEQKEQENFAISMDPAYRPPELIEAKSGSVVEVKLLRGPNWRTERTDTVGGLVAEIAHADAKSYAGVEEGGDMYSVEEHERVMALLEMIKTSRIKASRLEQDIT